MVYLNRRKHFERYMAAGSVLFIFSAVQYRLLYALTEAIRMRAGTAWAVHFLIGTIWSHAVHRGFTFRHAPMRPYLGSLFSTFAFYIFLLIVGTGLMVLLCDAAGVHPMLGWAFTSVFTAMGNYYILSRWTICRPSDEAVE